MQIYAGFTKFCHHDAAILMLLEQHGQSHAITTATTTTPVISAAVACQAAAAAAEGEVKRLWRVRRANFSMLPLNFNLPELNIPTNPRNQDWAYYYAPTPFLLDCSLHLELLPSKHTQCRKVTLRCTFTERPFAMSGHGLMSDYGPLLTWVLSPLSFLSPNLLPLLLPLSDHIL